MRIGLSHNFTKHTFIVLSHSHLLLYDLSLFDGSGIELISETLYPGCDDLDRHDEHYL